MSGRSPTARTLALFRGFGFLADVWEHWICRRGRDGAHIPRMGIRRDGFGIVDGVAIQPDAARLVFWQATAGSGVAARRAKSELAIWDERPVVRSILDSGAEYWIVGWRVLAGSRRVQPVVLRYAADRTRLFPALALAAHQEQSRNGELAPVRYSGFA